MGCGRRGGWKNKPRNKNRQGSEIPWLLLQESMLPANLYSDQHLGKVSQAVLITLALLTACRQLSSPSHGKGPWLTLSELQLLLAATLPTAQDSSKDTQLRQLMRHSSKV